MSIKSVFVSATLSLASGTAVANCPDKANLDDGVVLYRSAPFLGSLFKIHSGQLQEWRLTSKDGDTEIAFTNTNHALLAGSRLKGKTVIGLFYDTDVASLDDLPTSKQWQSEVTFRVGSAEKASGTVSIQYRNVHSHKLGECEFSVWEVDVTTSLSVTPTSTFRKFYAPSLGLVLGSIKLDANGNPISAVAYDTIYAR